MIRRTFPAILLAAGLAACNQTAAGPNGAPVPATAAPAPGEPGTPPAPAGTAVASAADPGCQNQLAEFQELLQRDVQSGNLKRDVYSRVVQDVRQAESACAAGRTVQARSILIATKRNYGYPA